ncbi:MULTISPECIES: hypothetical protein [Prochlorococcus]|uniref:hypothetical protein n=1 Tax=Prochlorococcus TaxID=1218 RepID=UPI000533702B|nr:MULTISPECIES: hypothetical protein [Prochlorococcus]KGG12008.1 hypothetical protein EV05_1211 [Prochlorococcus sp. MIT 0601]
MIEITPIYISPKGGSITCLHKGNKRIFQSCSADTCIYSRDLHSAKYELRNIESKLFIEPCRKKVVAAQRKTTLKWNNDGELSSIDKARVLSLLSENELTQCELNEEVA